MMKTGKSEPAAPKPLGSPLSAKATALKEAAEALKKALEAVDACLADYEKGEDEDEGYTVGAPPDEDD
jgi:hypothetical protein